MNTRGWEQQFVTAEAGSDRIGWRAGNDQMTGICHENLVPEFVEDEIATLYGSLYSSLPLLRAYDSLHDPVSTFVLYRNEEVDAIFLFRIHSSVLSVLNEGMQLNHEQAGLFGNYVFSRYPTVSVIRFSSVDLRPGGSLPFPHQSFQSLENLVLALPESVQAYHDSLSKNTRRNLKRYGERLVRDFPSFTWEVVEGSEVDDEDVRAIIRLNIVRMASKNKISAYDATETERMVALVRQCGLVGIARIDGRVCAGTLSFRTGSNYALSVLAHDPAYNDYSPGILCAYKAIGECIARGAREFHFLWGRYDYKFLLLAVERPLVKLSIYRSWIQMLMHVDLFLGAEVEAGRRRGIEWLHALGKQDTQRARLGLRILAAMRAARRATWH
ncbi:GNAT family N-acetyltransferase [Lacisediminimonas profundi]|uniref:GNAT family N-acetyltransferase n=1 Tax=Lacisediminimonas profundi TaxID=2603856 RepID=UPI0019D5BD84|nr:GNAT family N-acetyltransferase [Lacisediminimonas profundi]